MSNKTRDVRTLISINEELLVEEHVVVFALHNKVLFFARLQRHGANDRFIACKKKNMSNESHSASNESERPDGTSLLCSGVSGVPSSKRNPNAGSNSEPLSTTVPWASEMYRGSTSRRNSAGSRVMSSAGPPASWSEGFFCRKIALVIFLRGLCSSDAVEYERECKGRMSPRGIATC